MISRRGYTCDLAAGQGTSSNKIRTYPAGSVEPWNTRTGAKVARGGRGEEREEGKKRKRKREILKLSNPFFSFHHFGAKKQKRYRWNRRMRVLFAIFLGFWSSILIRRLETEKSLLKCFGIIKQSGRIAFVWL